MFIVSSTTICNASALETQNIPKRMLGRIAIVPRRGLSPGLLLRLAFETQLLRFLLPLIPFVFAIFVWPDMALPISQAPIAMVIAIAVVEMRVLAIKPEARDALIPDAEMARALDALRFNANAILTRIAAKRGMMNGELLLVVEQSELARITPLTLVSIQTSQPEPALLDLTEDERTLITERLFDDQLSEQQLHLISLREAENLRSVALETSTVSAHARMAALTAAAQ